jgi:amino acid transporter
MRRPPETEAAAAGGEPTLRRSIGPAQMALYGLGSMLGAGIYGLIGKAAGQAGNAVWLAFVIALLAALLAALSYASLGSRYPRAAGAAFVTERAYGFPLLSFVVGLALVCSGLTSIATQSRVFAANLADLLGTDSLPVAWLALGFLLVLTGIVFRGIRESMWINVLCTLIEAGGLVLVILVGLSFLGHGRLSRDAGGNRRGLRTAAHHAGLRARPSSPLSASRTCTMSPRKSGIPNGRCRSASSWPWRPPRSSISRSR